MTARVEVTDACGSREPAGVGLQQLDCVSGYEPIDLEDEGLPLAYHPQLQLSGITKSAEVYPGGHKPDSLVVVVSPIPIEEIAKFV